MYTLALTQFGLVLRVYVCDYPTTFSRILDFSRKLKYSLAVTYIPLSQISDY